MPIFSDEYLQLLIDEAEVEMSTDVKCIFNRFSIAITSGQSLYTLDETVGEIIAVTYKGYPLTPMSPQEGFETNALYDMTSSSPLGRPTHYIRHRINEGYYGIRFWPVPNESITADDTNIDGTDIENRCIISCYRIADPTGSTYRLPNNLMRRLAKYYVNYTAFLKEGKGQALRSSQHYKQRYDMAKRHLHEVYQTIPKAIVKAYNPNYPHVQRYPRPVLPNNFGDIVE